MNGKTKLNMTLVAPLFALFLAGCASTPPAPDLAASHPANPRAAQSEEPLPQPWLLNLTNTVMVKPVTEPAPEHQHGHEAKPNTATPPQHDHH